MKTSLSIPLRNGIWPRLRTSLIAGSIAIAVNTFILFAADWIPLATAHGGLLKLIKPIFSGPLRIFGVTSFWHTLGLPGPKAAGFKIGFHVAVGIVMAIFYAFAVEPILSAAAWVKGMVYGAFVWFANAIIILPLIGEGIAGSRHLTVAGMIYFAIAHTIFFVLQAILYDYLNPAPRLKFSLI